MPEASAALRPEAELLYLCARARMTEETAWRIQELLEEELDWERLTRIAVWHKLAPLLYWHLKELLQSARALPVPAGSVLGWGYDVIHWGAAVVEPSAPRISISLEFAGGELETDSDRIYQPEMERGWPSFSMRLKIAGRAILDYKKFEPLALRYAGLAERLLQS